MRTRFPRQTLICNCLLVVNACGDQLELCCIVLFVSGSRSKVRAYQRDFATALRSFIRIFLLTLLLVLQQCIFTKFFPFLPLQINSEYKKRFNAKKIFCLPVFGIPVIFELTHRPANSHCDDFLFFFNQLSGNARLSASPPLQERRSKIFSGQTCSTFYTIKLTCSSQYKRLIFHHT